MKPASTKVSYKIVANKLSNGSYSIGIAVTGVRPKRRKGGLVYEFVSMKERIPFEFDIDGIKMSADVELKIFRNLSRRQAAFVKGYKYTKLLEIPGAEIV